MKASSLLCFVFGPLSWLQMGPAAAQMRDQENAAPRVSAALVAAPETTPEPTASPAAAQRQQLLRDLTNMLQLAPEQVVFVRRALAASFAAASGAALVAPAPGPELQALLTQAQLARLRQWESALTAAQRLTLVACVH